MFNNKYIMVPRYIYKNRPIGAIGCLQTNTAMPQLCDISWATAETSCGFLPRDLGKN